MTDAPLFADAFSAAKTTAPQGDAPWRQAAFDAFAELGLPSQKREAWRHTSLAALKKPLEASSADTDLDAVLIDGAIQLVFVNGRFDADKSSNLEGVLGVTLTTIGKALAGNAADMIAAMDRAGDGPDDALVRLNQALVADGISVEIAEGAQIDTPIQLVFIGTASMAHIRNLVRVGAGASATLIETWTGNTGWDNEVVQIGLDAGATLHHLRLVDEAAEATNIAQTRIHLAEDSTYQGFVLLTGGQLSRHEVQAMIEGERAHCAIAGVGLGRDKQVRDIITHVDHAVPNSTSDQVIRHVMDDRAQAVFQGKVTVRRDAQHTDAQQSNKNMLLARTAVANTKPELVIFADDVKCAHGATVGELDETQLFYLRSRGIDPESARQLLIEGFINDVFEHVADETLREHLRGYARDWLTGDAA